MANVCTVIYQCEAQKEQLNELNTVLEILQKATEPLVANGRGKLWLGCIVNYLGGIWEDVDCRGEVVSYDFDGKSLSIVQETDWCEQGGFRRFLEQCFPGLKIYYLEIEPCTAWGATNDIVGKYFPFRYYMSIFDGYKFFNSLEEVAENVSKVVGFKVDFNFDTISNVLDDYTEEHKDDEIESYYNLYEIKMLD